MLPIVLIHGYASEGKKTSAADIYGELPAHLRQAFGEDGIVEIDLSRWLSLSDGVALDDVSFALERALNTRRFRHLLEGGFHVVIHSTGALVVRNWIRLYGDKPSPIANLVHLAGAHFGSGLAHIGRGQLARWGRLIFQGVGRGEQVLNELEFGASKTLDLHRYFLADGHDMYDDYQVQEFCMVGSQTLSALRAVPIRYVKEDSADNTVRTSAANLNFNYISLRPHASASSLTFRNLKGLREQRLENRKLETNHYEVDFRGLASSRREVPFTVVDETAHVGPDIGIVDGTKNRKRVVPLVVRALSTPYDSAEYSKVVEAFHANTRRTFERAAARSKSLTEWNKQAQYEAHSQVIFRVRDQFGVDVEDHDITFKSTGAGTFRLEKMIEDKHQNRRHPGNVTYYLRTQRFDRGAGWQDLLKDTKGIDLEITGEERDSEEIRYVPLTLRLSRARIPQILQNLRTTVVDVELLRVPSRQVLKLETSSS